MQKCTSIWVIARAGSAYRPLAVADTRLCGRELLEACLRLTKVFSDPSNRVPLEIELRLAANWYEDHGGLNTPARRDMSRRDHWPTVMPESVRFPFISTCLVLGATTAAGESVELRLPENEDPRSPCRDLHGLVHLFLDITDLDRLHYCFMVSQCHDQEITITFGDQPWSAWQYLEAVVIHWQCYRPEDDHEVPVDEGGIIFGPASRRIIGKARKVAKELHRLPLVHVSAIADVWPWHEAGPELPSVAPEPGYMHGHSKVSPGPVSLWDQAMAVLVQALLSSTELGQSLLDTAMEMPNFKSSLKRHLVAARQQLPEAPTTPALLRAAYAGDALLDWSPFDGLAPATIVAALSGPELQGACGLSLCADWSIVRAPDLAQAICTLPSLRDLYLMELPGRTADGPIGEFYIALMAHPHHPRGKILLCGAGSCALRHERWLPDERPLLALTTPNSVLQLAVMNEYSPRYCAASEYLSFGSDSILCLFLGDGFLTPVHVVNGIINFIAHALGREDGEPLSGGSPIILSSRAAPTLDDLSALEISLPPSESFAIAAWDIEKGSRLRDLRSDTWIAVLHIGRPDREWPEGGEWSEGGEGSDDEEGSADEEWSYDGELTWSPPLARCALVRPKRGTIRTDPTNPTLFRPEDLDVLSLEEFVRVAVSDLDTQSAISLDRRLRRLERLGLNPELSFSRAAVESKTICHWLNEANEDLRWKERVPWPFPRDK